jgi:hypothetical protein
MPSRSFQGNILKSWDPRIRVITALAGPCKILKTRLELSRIVRPMSVFYKFCTLVYVTVNILQSVHDNDLTGENYWTFGQIFTMVNMAGTLAVLVSHFMPSWDRRVLLFDMWLKRTAGGGSYTAWQSSWCW